MTYIRSMFAKRLLPAFFCLLCACHSPAPADIHGLWALQKYELDAVEKPSDPLFLEFNDNRSFAVSRVSGDLAGVYSQHSHKISLYSTDRQWFNSTWSVYRIGETLELRGKDERLRNVRLIFRHIDDVPDFQEFENKVLGRWQLYKIRKNGEIVDRLADTWFSIAGDGTYSISGREGVLEAGRATINTRHRKILFEKDMTEWSAWFYGRELRLTNNETGMEYCLRKSLDGEAALP